MTKELCDIYLCIRHKNTESRGQRKWEWVKRYEQGWVCGDESAQGMLHT